MCIIVEQVYLGDVANEFIYNQCKRNGMHKDIYLYMKCNTGPEANALYSVAKISL